MKYRKINMKPIQKIQLSAACLFLSITSTAIAGSSDGMVAYGHRMEFTKTNPSKQHSQQRKKEVLWTLGMGVSYRVSFCKRRREIQRTF